MDNPQRAGRRHLGLGFLLLLIAGCEASASEPMRELGETEDTVDVVCPSCGPSAGGETGDFGADIAACAAAYTKRMIDAEEGDALGFDASDAVRAIETVIDSEMTWAVIDSDDGDPASGFEPQTRVHLALAVDALSYQELDVELCTSDDCRIQAEEGQCEERLIWVSASGQLHTEDGAIAVELASQYVRILRPGDDDVSVAAQANLRDVTGSLQLAPSFPEPRLGVLNLSLDFDDEATFEYGVIDIDIWRDLDQLREDDGGLDYNERGALCAHYRPLQGRWGSPPPVSTWTGCGMPQP
jgi:hypothetical protein